MAARDAARALADPEQWEDLVDELVTFTDDPQVLADAVRQIIAKVELLAGLRGVKGATEQGEEVDIEHVDRLRVRCLVRTL
jgi:hypothetical protein